MIKDQLHKQIVKHYNRAEEWFFQKSQGQSFPFYCSFDLRDSSQKIAPVDANLFPAGFNNICEVDKKEAPGLCEEFLKTIRWHQKKALLLAEEHTHNPFYWDNIHTLKQMLERSQASSVKVCVPGMHILKNTQLLSATGHKMEIFLLKNQMHQADFIISNNDFSVDYGLKLPIPMTPPLSAGWETRRKHSFFEQYNRLAEEFAHLIEVESDRLSIKTKRFQNFDISNKTSLKNLKEEVHTFLNSLEKTYKAWNQKPFVFLKNNSGTYGLGMTAVHSVSDIDQWNYKMKKKMKAAKGGKKVTELIIQEGLMSSVKTEGAVAEPVIYLIGPKLAGGFLRTHKEKGVKDNLNSPGAVFKTLCISDLKIEVAGKPMENVYGWLAHLGVLALAKEFKNTGFV